MSASASAGSSSRWHRRFPTPTSFEPLGPRSTVRLSEPSAHRRTPESHDPPNNPTNPPQRARSYAQTTGACCGIADVNLPQHSIKWREKSGLDGRWTIVNHKLQRQFSANLAQAERDDFRSPVSALSTALLISEA